MYKYNNEFKENKENKYSHIDEKSNSISNIELNNDEDFLQYVQSMTHIPSLELYDPIHADESSFSYTISFQREKIESILEKHTNNRTRLENEIKDYPDKVTNIVNDTETLKKDMSEHSKQIIDVLSWDKMNKQREDNIEMGKKILYNLGEMKLKYMDEMLSNPSYAFKQYHEELKLLVKQLTDKLNQMSSDMIAMKNKEDLWIRNVNEKDNLLIFVLKREEVINTKLRGKIAELQELRMKEKNRIEEYLKDTIEQGLDPESIYNGYKVLLQEMETKNSYNKYDLLNNSNDKRRESLINESEAIKDPTRLEIFLSKYSEKLKDIYIHPSPDPTISDGVKKIQNWINKKNNVEDILTDQDIEEILSQLKDFNSEINIQKENTFGAGYSIANMNDILILTNVSKNNSFPEVLTINKSSSLEKFDNETTKYQNTNIESNQDLDINESYNLDQFSNGPLFENKILSDNEKNFLEKSLALESHFHEVVEGIPQSHYSPGSRPGTTSPRKRPDSKELASRGELSKIKPPSRSNRLISSKEIHTQTDFDISHEDSISYFHEQLKSLDESKTNIRKLEKELDESLQTIENQKNIFEEKIGKKDKEIARLKKLLLGLKTRKNIDPNQLDSDQSFHSLMSPLSNLDSKPDIVSSRDATQILHRISDKEFNQELKEWKNDIKVKIKKKNNHLTPSRRYSENSNISDLVPNPNSFVLLSDRSSKENTDNENQFIVKIDPFIDVSLSPYERRVRLQSQDKLHGSHMVIHPHPRAKKRNSLPVLPQEKKIEVNAHIERVINNYRKNKYITPDNNSYFINDEEENINFKSNKENNHVSEFEDGKNYYQKSIESSYIELNSPRISIERVIYSNSLDHEVNNHESVNNSNLFHIETQNVFNSNASGNLSTLTQYYTQKNQSFSPFQASTLSNTDGSQFGDEHFSDTLESLSAFDNLEYGTDYESMSISSSSNRITKDKFQVNISSGGSPVSKKQSILPSIPLNKSKYKDSTSPRDSPRELKDSPSNSQKNIQKELKYASPRISHQITIPSIPPKIGKSDIHIMATKKNSSTNI